MPDAVKFSPEDSVVILAAEGFVRGDGFSGVRFRVTDHGPGIPSDLQETIFEKFRQADASHTRSFGGTGLGLAISRDDEVMRAAEARHRSEDRALRRRRR